MDVFASLGRSFSYTADDGLPILMYHKVAAYQSGAAIKAHYVAPALFRSHLSFLAASGYRTLGVADIIRYVRGEPIGVERPIAITFDDGYDCVYTDAFPALREFGFSALVFVLAGHIGGVNDWEVERPFALEPMLTAAHIAEMAPAGIEFGSHGVRHERMTRLDSALLSDDFRASKRMIEDITGQPVTAVAYPFGDHDDRVRQLAAEAGYAAGCTVERGVNRPGAEPLALKRINIRRYSYLPLFRLKLRRAYGMARAAQG